MMGRAGRRGEPATGVLVMPYDKTKGFFQEYAAAKCRRFVVSAYLDGKGVTYSYSVNRCDKYAGPYVQMTTTFAARSTTITPEMSRVAISSGTRSSGTLLEVSPAIV